MNDVSLQNSIKPFDIVGLVETHCDTDDLITLDGFECIQINRTKKTKARRASGGIAILIKKHIRPLIKIQKTSEISIWIQINKSFTKSSKDIYVCITYLPPENSTFCRSTNEDPLELLSTQIEEFSSQGNIIIMGDLNARTANKADYIPYDENSFIMTQLPYEADEFDTNRQSQDTSTNDRGKQLLQLCIAAKLRIMNGRKIGDTLGYFTCHKYNGSSCVDYGIVSEDAYSFIDYFHVHRNISDLSDHCQISLQINNVHIPTKQIEHTDHIFTAADPEYKWSTSSHEDYKRALYNMNNEIDKLSNQRFEENEHGVNSAVNQLKTLILTAADHSLKKRPKPNKPKKNPSQKWYTTDLHKQKKELMKLGKHLSMHPHNTYIRDTYFFTLRTYRNRCKTESRNYKAKLIKQLDELHNNNPSEYWNILKKFKTKVQTDNSINIKQLYDHYKKLNENNTTNQTNLDEKIKDMELRKTFTKLDYKITEKEVYNAIKSLKNNKSPGTDHIRNEMLKSGIDILTKPLTTIFNLILRTGIYPNDWSKGKIISVHKSGDKSDPQNYRGLCLSSAVSKLLNKILNDRLDLYINENHSLPDEQVGFRKKMRTSDHLLIVNSLIEKYKKEKKTLYLTFIDFRKAFDTICHKGLYLKLLQSGISGKYYELIKSMYNKAKLVVEHNNLKSPEFPSKRGVRQGDNLSPTLFNLFVKDIPRIFNSHTNSVKFGDLPINSLQYADDLIIFANSKDTMQEHLNMLNNYCKNWGLEINTKKTKYMTINCNSNNNLTIDDRCIEKVPEYKYLGILINGKGETRRTKTDIANRALKSYFKLIKTIQPTPNIKTMIHLFDHLIKPILLYGCEILTPTELTFKPPKAISSHKQQFTEELKLHTPIAMKLTNNPQEKIHLNFCKYILGVNRKTSNLAVYSELGRYPLYIDQILHTIKYTNYIKHETKNKLVKRFANEMHQTTQTHTNIFTFTNQILTKLQLQHILNCKITNQHIKLIKSKLRSEFEGYWRKHITTNISTSCNKVGNNKLRTFKLFKTKFTQEKYLEIEDPSLRKSLSQFRTSSHKLKIETQRYNSTKYIPPNERICLNCSSNSCEDEKHFLIDCQAFNNKRTILFNEVTNMNPLFQTYSSINKLIWLMSQENISLLKLTASFIKTTMEERIH